MREIALIIAAAVIGLLMTSAYGEHRIQITPKRADTASHAVPCEHGSIRIRKANHIYYDDLIIPPGALTENGRVIIEAMLEYINDYITKTDILYQTTIGCRDATWRDAQYSKLEEKYEVGKRKLRTVLMKTDADASVGTFFYKYWDAADHYRRDVVDAKSAELDWRSEE